MHRPRKNKQWTKDPLMQESRTTSGGLSMSEKKVKKYPARIREEGVSRIRTGEGQRALCRKHGIGRYPCFFGHERIYLKTGAAQLTLRRSALASDVVGVPVKPVVPAQTMMAVIFPWFDWSMQPRFSLSSRSITFHRHHAPADGKCPAISAHK